MTASELLQRIGVEPVDDMVRVDALDDLAAVVAELEQDAKRLQFLTRNWMLLAGPLRAWTLDELRAAIDLQRSASGLRT
jgi:hypothetical protein